MLDLFIESMTIKLVTAALRLLFRYSCIRTKGDTIGGKVAFRRLCSARQEIVSAVKGSSAQMSDPAARKMKSRLRAAPNTAFSLRLSGAGQMS